MPRLNPRSLLSILVIVLPFAGCVEPVTLGEAASTSPMPGSPVNEEGDFVVDRLRSGDHAEYELHYEATQFGDTSEAPGSLAIDVTEGGFRDGFGIDRPAVRAEKSVEFVFEGDPQRFAELAYLDPESQMQLRQDFPIVNQNTNRFPAEPLTILPVARQTQTEMTGVVEDYAPNPLGRGMVIYGSFLGNRTLTDGAAIEFWGLLQSFGPFTANVKAATSKDGLPLRIVTIDALQKDEMSSAHVIWRGEFVSDCPLPLNVHQTRAYEFGGQTFDDELTAQRTMCERGPAAPDVPTSPAWAERRAGEHAEWDRLPPDGAGPQPRFRLSEMYTTLAQHPTASTYFGSHPDAYLHFAYLEEIDTCPVYGGVPPPGCHWDTWRGAFQDGDNTMLIFTVERYSNEDGAGVAYVPVVEREYPFNDVFSLAPPGGVPQAPPGPPVVITTSQDLPSRDEVADKTFPVSAAVSLWQETAAPGYVGLVPNVVQVFLGPDGYEYQVSRIEAVYPDPAPLFPLYGSGVQAFDVHFIHVFGDGYLRFSVNVDLEVRNS